MMSNYNEKVRAWLDTKPEERDLTEGATLMLQGNRNKILFRNVLQKNNLDKVEYELRKILKNRENNCGTETIQQMNTEVEKIVQTIPEKENGKGKRGDHNNLPPEIQYLYDRNMLIYPEMRSIHERLKVLNKTGTDCDRYPFLKRLIELDRELRENWDKYDQYIPGQEINEDDTNKIDARRISANRKYISLNKGKLKKHLEKEEPEKTEKLRTEMYNRYKELVENGETFNDKQIEELKELGVIPNENIE